MLMLYLSIEGGREGRGYYVPQINKMHGLWLCMVPDLTIASSDI